MNKTLALTAIAVAILLSSPAQAAPTVTQVGSAVNISNSFPNSPLQEASGLGISKNQTTLWSITDDNCTVYQIQLSGAGIGYYPGQPSSCPSGLSSSDFEGVTYGPPPPGVTDDHFLYIADENGNRIVKFNYQTPQFVSAKSLSSMANYSSSSVTCDGAHTVADEFNGSDANSGLEGITWDPDLNSFFVIKEKDPGLMIRISADLSTIQACKVLTFSGADYSDISYDSTRGQFWIVSDEAQKLYLYNWGTNTVVTNGTYPLGYAHAEGVAFNPANSRLYIATDNGNGNDSYLYTYNVQ
jgi:uncharacterized protein YjiK